MVVGDESQPLCVRALDFSVFNDSWIFTNKILIDCDGTQFQWNVSHGSSQKRDVFWGGVYESYAIYDSDMSFGGEPLKQEKDNYIELSPIIEAIEKAERIVIRFDGSSGRKDITISQSQQTIIKEFWEISNILYQNPDLIQYLL